MSEWGRWLWWVRWVVDHLRYGWYRVGQWRWGLQADDFETWWWYDDAARQEEEFEGWLCTCGHWEESQLHCSSCGREPPWGCDCGECWEEANRDEALELWEEYPGGLLSGWEEVEEPEEERRICPTCGADVPADGGCWYCEEVP